MSVFEKVDEIVLHFTTFYFGFDPIHAVLNVIRKNYMMNRRRFLVVLAMSHKQGTEIIECIAKRMQHAQRHFFE